MVRTAAVWAVGAAAVLVGLACSEEKCGRGEPCDKACPAGQEPICVVDGICRCQADTDGGTGGQSGTGGAGTGGGSVVPPPADCDPPQPGELLINEVMLDGEADGEPDEFVELVNTANHPIALGGLVVATAPEGSAPDVPPAEPVARWTFTSGCIVASSAVAIYRKADLYPPVSVTPPLQSIMATYGGRGLNNSDPFDFRLLHGVTQIDRFAGAANTFDPGVSANRNRDGLPEGVPAKHTDVSSNGLKSSPGRCANGGSFEASCGDAVLPPIGGMNMGGMGGGGGQGGDGGHVPVGGTGGMPMGGAEPPPPVCNVIPPGAVVINEVLANTNAAQPQEFVEIVNTTAADIPMDGWTFNSVTGAGSFSKRLTIGTGVLPARGAVAVFGDLPPDQWVWDPMPAALPTVAQKNWSLLDNGDPLTVRIDDAAMAVVATADVPKVANKDGKSANLCHDVDGSGWVVHDTLSATVASPGKCANGGAFSADCAPPAPGSMP